MTIRDDVRIRPETPKDYHDVVSLVLRSFSEGTNYSDGTDVVALIEEIRMSPYYMPALSFVAEVDGRIAGHFMFSRFPLSRRSEGPHDDALLDTDRLVMLSPVSVHPDFFRQKVGTSMLMKGLAQVAQGGWRGVTVEGNFNFYNTLGFRTSSEYGVYPTCGDPMEDPRCMMIREVTPGSLEGIRGFVVYDMYYST